MRRGISPILAELLLIVIVVGLGAMAYSYFTGLQSAQTQRKAFALSGARLFASDRALYFNLENRGTVAITALRVDLVVGGGRYGWSQSFGPLGSGGSRAFGPVTPGGTYTLVQGKSYAAAFTATYADGSTTTTVVVLTAE